MVEKIDEETQAQIEQNKYYANLEEQLLSEPHKKVVEYALKEKKRADTNWDANYELRQKLEKAKEVAQKLSFEIMKLLED